ncbi:esterase-like activity of phytase family protein [Pseudomonas sp. BMS12]|uniref:esterase-like activity of phytase family protein n=1 Tax=Pseudomonas sp. BMS12 TaxID=1796033 RepID=UPI00083A07D6|nr:esterase-like activity of phytase family protein [Pseudomonas sp. BMS12]
MTRHFALLGLLFCTTTLAAEAPAELELLGEHPIEGLVGGNLSGLTRCGEDWLAVSDREDDRLYHLQPGDAAWQAKAETFSAPPVPPSGLPWGLRMRTWVANQVRGGDLDFEGIGCDAMGNRYLVSEAHAAVLQVGPSGLGDWLQLPGTLVRQARASGMLLHYNALFEGLAIDPAGERLWLAAERDRRGLLVLHRDNQRWRCTGGCVLSSDTATARSPATPQDEKRYPLDYSDLSYHADKLFSLQRLERRICRRTPSTGEAEKCWSYAAAALAAPQRFPQVAGIAEALWLDQEGAWVGLDTGAGARSDGEKRPLLWHFKAPAGGWSAP